MCEVRRLGDFSTFLHGHNAPGFKQMQMTETNVGRGEGKYLSLTRYKQWGYDPFWRVTFIPDQQNLKKVRTYEFYDEAQASKKYLEMAWKHFTKMVKNRVRDENDELVEPHILAKRKLQKAKKK